MHIKGIAMYTHWVAMECNWNIYHRNCNVYHRNCNIYHRICTAYQLYCRDSSLPCQPRDAPKDLLNMGTDKTLWELKVNLTFESNQNHSVVHTLHINYRRQYIRYLQDPDPFFFARSWSATMRKRDTLLLYVILGYSRINVNANFLLLCVYKTGSKCLHTLRV